MPPDHTPAAGEETDLLDFLVTLAENIKLLILAPLTAGLLAFVMMSFSNAVFESSFILQFQKKVGLIDKPIDLLTITQLNELVTSPAVLADTAKAQKTNGQEDWAILLKQPGAVTAQVQRNTSQVQVTVKGPSHQTAQAMAQALLKATLENSQPKGEVLKVLQTAAEKNKAALARARQLESRISNALNDNKGVDPIMVQAYYTLMGTMPNLTLAVELSQLKIQGLTETEVISQPTLPNAPATTKRTLVTAIAVLATVFALLLWVFMRKALQDASLDPVSAAKIARIRQALGIKLRD